MTRGQCRRHPLVRSIDSIRLPFPHRRSPLSIEWIRRQCPRRHWGPRSTARIPVPSPRRPWPRSMGPSQLRFPRRRSIQPST